MSMASRLVRLGLFALAALIGASGLLLTDGAGTTSAAPTTYTAIAGGEGPGTAVYINVFEPSALVVSEGDSITWKGGADEPHTVTFLSGQPPKGITIDNVDQPIGPKNPSYDGKDQLSSGFIDKTSSYTVKFTKAGSYPFLCLIHPGMEGSVTVIAANNYVPSQAQIDAEGKKAQAAGVAAAQRMLAGVPTSATRSGSGATSTWTIPASPVLKVTGGFVAQNAFTPARINIGAGDTVTWLNDSPQAHTVTLTGGGPPAGDPTKPTKVTSYTGGFASSGLLGSGPADLFTGGNKYSLTFPTPGTYPFICILHVDQGMAGVIIVGPAGSGGAAEGGPGPVGPTGPAVPALRPPATGDAGLAGYGVAAWPLALVVGLLGLGGLAAMKVRAQA